MKLTVRTNQGGTLAPTIMVCSIIALTLGGYLALVGSQNRSIMRSQAWNECIPVIEAGVEEAMAHLARNGSGSLATDNWNMQGGYYVKTRYLGRSYCQVGITTSTPPVIVSRGYARIPMASNYVQRTVRVTTRNNGTFMKAMVAKQDIDFNGNNIRTDSFDSTDPAWSTNGTYTPARFKDGGDVASNSGIVGILNTGNADVYGRASTGPGGSLTLGPNGAVGSKAWHAAGTHGVEPGWSSDDMNVEIPDVTLPTATWNVPAVNVSVGGTNYNYAIGAGYRTLSSVSMSGSQKMIVTGHAVLYVPGNFSMAGNSFIYIATNASLTLIVGGSSASLGGNGVVNGAGNATNFFYKGLPNNTSLSFSGNAAFTGMIYAPQAAFTLNGGGSSTIDFIGASVTRTVTMNGHFNFHYDEALGRIGPSQGFQITSWNEISNADPRAEF